MISTSVRTTTAIASKTPDVSTLTAHIIVVPVKEDTSVTNKVAVKTNQDFVQTVKKYFHILFLTLQ